MDVIYTIVEFFVQGGLFMYPILLVFAVGAAIAIERYVTLTLLTKRNQAVWGQVQPLLTKRDFDKAREVTAKDDSTVAQLLNMGLERQGAVRRRDDIEIAMEEGMMEIMPQLEKRTGYVGLAANVATLLGARGISLTYSDVYSHAAGQTGFRGNQSHEGARLHCVRRLRSTEGQNHSHRPYG
jgi:biopolymer transport protein ExbB